MKIEEIETKRTHEKPRRYGKLIPIAAVLAAVLALSAAAYGFVHSDFYKNAFGTGVEKIEPRTVEHYDENGRLFKTEHQAGVDRIEADPETADKLVGDAVGDVGESVKVGDFTVTVRDCVFDENGIGVVTVDIEHPQGHTRYNESWWSENGYPYANQEHFEVPGLRDPMDDIFPRIISSHKSLSNESTDTLFRVVYYVNADGAETEDVDLEYVFSAATPFAQSLTKAEREAENADYPQEQLWEEARIPIRIEKRVEAKEFVCCDKKIMISPLGAKLDLGTFKQMIYGEQTDVVPNLKSFVITFTDGSEYTLIDGNNAVRAGRIGYDNVYRISFFGLVDDEKIESVSITTYEENFDDDTELTFTRP